jgi:hypothetical protein
MFCNNFLNDQYLALLSDWLASYSHSTTPVTDTVFTNAASYCLDYLCARGKDSTTLKRPLSKRIQSIRRTRPWRWRQRRFREELGALDTTPWMWLSKWTNVHPVPLRGSKYRRKLFYALLPRATALLDRSKNNGKTEIPESWSVVFSRIHSEKYWLALHYLTLFLPRAGHSPTLIDMCDSRIFAFRSQEFGKKSRQARAAMRQYLAKSGPAADTIIR